MKGYRAPIETVRFLLYDVLQIDRDPATRPLLGDLTREDIDAVLEAGAQLAQDVLAPINYSGDREGCRRTETGHVSTPAGFADAFRLLSQAGWGALSVPACDGGQGVPQVVAVAIAEFFNGANQSFAMYTNWAHYASILLAGDETRALRERFLPPLIAGEWLATMALTEPEAGTDLGLMRTRAMAVGDGTYAITGTKIFISGGDHDLTDNIVHFVLARIGGDESGLAGISMFAVPRDLPEGGNGVHCISLESKMGLNASATCTMQFDGARGWLIGEPDTGLARMFRLMNHIRRMTGTIAVAGSEAAVQGAADYVRDRRQGRAFKRTSGANALADPLIEQPDVRRLLMEGRSFIDPARLLVIWLSLQIDILERSVVTVERNAARDRLDLLTPVAKAALSDIGLQCAVQAQQLFGGHGYMTATGIDQYVRDMRMLHLAEGANGVQARDLVLRKLRRDGGAVLNDYLAHVSAACALAPRHAALLASDLAALVDEVRQVGRELCEGDAETAAYGAYGFMSALGIAALGHMWMLIIQADQQSQDQTRLARAEFFAGHYLPVARSWITRARASSVSIAALPAAAF